MMLELKEMTHKTGILIVLILAILIFFFIVPLTNDAFKDKEELRKRQNLLNIIQNDKKNLLVTSSDVLANDLNNDSGILERLFITKEEIEDIIENLEIESNLKNIKTKIKIENQDPTKISLNLNLEGAFEDIYFYLKKIVNLPYAVIIESLKLQKQGLSTNIKSEFLENPPSARKIDAYVKLNIYTKEFLK